MAVKEQPESEDFLPSKINVSGLSLGQEISVRQYEQMLDQMSLEQLKDSCLYLYEHSIKMTNTIRLQAAQLLDNQELLPGFNCEEDLRKRLDLQK